MYFSEKSIFGVYLVCTSRKKVYMKYIWQMYFIYTSNTQVRVNRGFSVKGERLFLIAVNREWKNIFLVILKKRNPVIREMTNLFLEIRGQGL